MTQQGAASADLTERDRARDQTGLTVKSITQPLRNPSSKVAIFGLEEEKQISFFFSLLFFLLLRHVCLSVSGGGVLFKLSLGAVKAPSHPQGKRFHVGR